MMGPRVLRAGWAGLPADSEGGTMPGFSLGTDLVFARRFLGLLVFRFFSGWVTGAGVVRWTHPLLPVSACKGVSEAVMKIATAKPPVTSGAHRGADARGAAGHGLVDACGSPRVRSGGKLDCECSCIAPPPPTSRLLKN